jgi:hypothetical protein
MKGLDRLRESPNLLRFGAILKDWLDDLNTLHKKFNEQRTSMNKYVTRARREEERVKKVLYGQNIKRAARRAAESSARNKKRAEDARKNRERYGTSSSSSIVEKSSDRLEGRGEITRGLEIDTDAVRDDLPEA